MKISLATATGLLLAIRATRTFGAPMGYSCPSLALTGVVPATCDAEAGEFHEFFESQGPSSPRWIDQENPPVLVHDAITVSDPGDPFDWTLNPPQEARKWTR